MRHADLGPNVLRPFKGLRLLRRRVLFSGVYEEISFLAMSYPKKRLGPEGPSRVNGRT